MYIYIDWNKFVFLRHFCNVSSHFIYIRFVPTYQNIDISNRRKWENIAQGRSPPLRRPPLLLRTCSTVHPYQSTVWDVKVPNVSSHFKYMSCPPTHQNIDMGNSKKWENLARGSSPLSPPPLATHLQDSSTSISVLKFGLGGFGEVTCIPTGLPVWFSWLMWIQNIDSLHKRQRLSEFLHWILKFTSGVCLLFTKDSRECH